MLNGVSGIWEDQHGSTDTAGKFQPRANTQHAAAGICKRSHSSFSLKKNNTWEEKCQVIFLIISTGEHVKNAVLAFYILSQSAGS